MTDTEQNAKLHSGLEGQSNSFKKLIDCVEKCKRLCKKTKKSPWLQAQGFYKQYYSIHYFRYFSFSFLFLSFSLPFPFLLPYIFISFSFHFHFLSFPPLSFPFLVSRLTAKTWRNQLNFIICSSLKTKLFLGLRSIRLAVKNEFSG